MHYVRSVHGHVAVQAYEVMDIIFFPGIEDSELLRWSRSGHVFGLPPDHSTLGLITKTSIPVWSWSHTVRTLMKNMWSYPDTQSEETQSLTPSFSPPFHLPSPISSILSCSISFTALSTFSVGLVFIVLMLLGPLFLYASLSLLFVPNFK